MQYLLDATAEAVAPLRAVLAGLGDSLVVVGADEGAEVTTWNVHVHVNDVGGGHRGGGAGPAGRTGSRSPGSPISPRRCRSRRYPARASRCRVHRPGRWSW